MKKFLLKTKELILKANRVNLFNTKRGRVFVLVPIVGLASFLILFTPTHSAHAAFSIFQLAFGGIPEIIVSLLEVIILPLASAILALVGLVMDAAINFSLHTAYIFSLSPAINMGWTIIRDVCNMFFIFVLIYISIGTIIKGSGFETKKLLTQVIIAALLINFSLFATKVVIDISNIFGNWLYGGIQKTLSVNTVGNPAPGSKESISVSGLIANRLGILTLWTSVTAKGDSPATTLGDKLTDPTSNIIGGFIRLAIVLIAIYIFCYCSVLFISRSVTLLFLLVFSPLGFMGNVLPKLKDHAKAWREELLNAAIFPIAFLLMFYIALQFINSLGSLGSALPTASIPKVLGVSGATVSTYFQYFLIIFLLKACLETAKDNAGKMGKALGGVAEGLGKTLVGVGIGAATGGTGLALRATLGRGASMVAESQWAKNMEATRRNTVGGFATSVLGSGIRTAAQSTSKQTFDASGAASGALGGVGVKSSIPKWMQGPKDGYVGAQKARAKAETERAGEMYASPAQDALVNSAIDAARPGANAAVAVRPEGLANNADQEALRTQITNRTANITRVKADIAAATAANNVGSKIAFEADLKKYESEQQIDSKKLEDLEKAYERMVGDEIRSRLDVARTAGTTEAKALDAALKATNRLENYAMNIQEASIKKMAATATAFVAGAVPGGYKAAQAIEGQVTAENKKLADKIREDKDKNTLKNDRDNAALLNRLRDAMEAGSKPPAPPKP